MATTEEALRQIITILESMETRLSGVERRLRDVEAGQPSAADEAVARLAKLGGSATPAALPKPPQAPPAAPPELPEDWHAMSEEQQQAWLRAHTGLTPPPEKDAEIETFELNEGSGINFPVPPEDLRGKWAVEAEAIFENWVIEPKKGIIIDGDAAAEAYAKAGPLWLAAYAHDFLMGLPSEWRRGMVQDVSEYAPQAGLELGRDILRASFDQANDRAYDVALWHADQRPSAGA